MKPSVWIGVVLLLVVGAVLVALFGGARESSADEAVSAPHSGAIGTAERQHTERDAPDASTPVERVTPEVASGREEVAPSPTRGGLELLVVGPAGERPSAGAEVRFLFGDDALRSRAESPTRVDELLAGSPLLHTDASGRVALPAAPDGAAYLLASARNERAWGRTHVELADLLPGEPRTIVLAVDVTLEVQVVDPRGQPVPGTRVVILQGDRSAISSSLRAATAEGPAAIARFPHAQETVRGRNGSAWRVAVDALLEEGGELALVPGSLPETVVTLVLPTTGSVEVRVLGDGGTPAAEAGSVSLGIVGEGQPRRISPFSNTTRRRYRVDADEGVAVFPHVDLGKELEVSAKRQGSDVESSMYGMGPMRAGQRAVFELVLGADHPVLVGRAVDETSAALADQELTVRVFRNSRHLSGSEYTVVQTDADGRFRVDVASDWAEGTTRTLTLLDGDAERPRRSVLVDLSHELQDGPNDLGDLTLAPPTLFVAGRVLDHAGEGYPGAELVLERKRTANEGWWRKVDNFDLLADGSGRFEARGSYPGDAFRILARARSGLARPIEFRPGESDLVLTLQPTGSVAGSVLLDEKIDPELIRVRVSSSEGGPTLDHIEWHERSVELDSEGRFRFPKLLPGGYTVRVEAERAGTKLLEVPGVIVAAEQETLDPRLQEIDLRGALHQLELNIIGPEGTGRLQGTLSYGPAGGGSYEHQLYFYNNPVKLLATTLPLDLSIEVGGCRLTKLESVAENRDVRVERGPEIRVLLTGAAQIPDPPYFIKVTLVPLEGEPDIDWTAPCFDEQRALTLHAPGPGRMRVQWLVERRASNGAVATMADPAEEQLVDVLDQESGQVIEVALDEAGLEALLAELD